MPVVVLEGIDERSDSRFSDQFERLDSLPLPAIPLITERADQFSDRRFPDQAERPCRTHLDRGIRVVEGTDQWPDCTRTELCNRRPLFLRDQVTDRLFFGLWQPPYPPENLSRSQPYAVVLIQERLCKSGDGRSAGPREGLDHPEPQGIVRPAECHDERIRCYISETDEQIPSSLPDPGVIAPERPDERLDGSLPHRCQNLCHNLSGIVAPEHRDERNGGRPSKPFQHPGCRLAEPFLIQRRDQVFDGCLPHLHQYIPRGSAEVLFTKQADQ